MKLLTIAFFAALIPLSSHGQTPVSGGSYVTGPVKGRSVYEVAVTKGGEISGRVKISGGKEAPDSVKRSEERARYDLRTMTYFYEAAEVSIVAETGAPKKIIEELVSLCLQAHISKIAINANFTTPGWHNFRKVKSSPAKPDGAGKPEDKER